MHLSRAVFKIYSELFVESYRS